MPRYVIKVEGFANGTLCPIAGQYLKIFDFEADQGRGYGEFGYNLAEAMKFDTLEEARDFWNFQSVTVPFRPDGEPNKPLTCTSVTFLPIPTNH